MMKYKIIMLAILIGCTYKIQAQNTSASAAVSQTMQNIYKNYDSIKYLSFDVKFNYGSDTLLGKYDAEQMDGSYTMAGKRAKYRLGDIDFMQNDSFFIAVYNKDKLILVDEPKSVNIGTQLPLRQQMDSLMLSYANQYTFSDYSQSTDTGIIQLLRADSLAQFDRFSIVYNNRTKMLYSVSYEYAEPAALDSVVLNRMMASSGSTTPPMQKKRLTISFHNYRFDNYDDAVYDENNYIWFENGICKPTAKYDDYKIYYSKPATTNLIEN